MSNEKKYLITNEYGEAVRVTEEEYLKWKEENHKIQAKAPKFRTPEEQEARRKVIDNVIEDLNQENLTDTEMYQIENKVKTKTEEDIEKENRERLDDDLRGFNTPQQQETIEGKDSKINNIINMLNNLNLSEEEMIRLEKEVERNNDPKTKDENIKEKEDGR